MAKPVLAILTDTIRFDNHHPLKYFKKIQPVHFYRSAPYGDMSRADLKGAIRYQNFQDLEKRLVKLKPAIIQGAEPYGSKNQLRMCWLAFKLSRQLKIPLIFPMWENRPVKERFGAALGKIMTKILARYGKQARIIFSLNEGAKKNLLAAGIDPKKIKKLLYGIWGIDIDLFKPDIPPLGWGLGQYILFVGRLDEAKGIPDILAAWQKIKAEFPQVELIFIGEGELARQVKGERVKKLGALKNKELPAYFANALFTLYPSVTLKRWEEQVGMVNLQSLACGTSVITTKSGAIPEYVNDKVGILVPERDSKALAEAMRKLLKNEKLRKKLGANGRQYILKNFDAQKTVQKVEGILLGLL